MQIIPNALRYFLISLFSCVIICSQSYADIYRYENEEGVVHFTDAPEDQKLKLFLVLDENPPIKNNTIAKIKATKFAYFPNLVSTIIFSFVKGRKTTHKKFSFYSIRYFIY